MKTSDLFNSETDRNINGNNIANFANKCAKKQEAFGVYINPVIILDLKSPRQCFLLCLLYCFEFTQPYRLFPRPRVHCFP